jgi:hypothetical protein
MGEGPAHASRDAHEPNEGPATDTENADSWRWEAAPHEGQGTGATSSRRWMRSNALSQAGQRYSKMGMDRSLRGCDAG